MILLPGSTIKTVAVLIMVMTVAAGLWYVTALRADLAISEQNRARLQEGVTAQQALMAQLRNDIRQIQAMNQDLRSQNLRQQAEVQALTQRFAQTARGEVRDFGALAAERPEAVQRAVNRGTVNAMRCLEIASGSPLTVAEKNATTLSEINRECPTLANPRYRAAAGQ